jgi:Sulfotransferase domain
VRNPNFFIVGAPRCGTGSLWTYLKGHPEIYMSTPKELYFFDTDLRENSESLPSLEQYLAVFSAAGNQKKIGEATPSYLRSEHAPEAIKAFSPGAQIIIMLRNPIDVMSSLHSSALDGLEPITDFEAALEADARRTGRERIGYREFTDFPGQVQRYFDLFGRENVHTIIYDDLKKSSAAVYESTLCFLGVNLGFAPAFTVMGANRYVRSLPLQRILVRPPRALREIGRALLPSWLRVQIRVRLLKLNTVVRARSPLDPELRRRLQKEFEPKIERLSKLLGRDLSGWCKD